MTSTSETSGIGVLPDGRLKRGGDGAEMLHRMKRAQNPADFYERNRRILLIPRCGGLGEIRLACCGAEVGDAGRSVSTPVCWLDHTPQ